MDTEQWREEVDHYLESAKQAAYTNLDLWIEAEDAESMSYAAAALGTGEAYQNTQACLWELENWLHETHTAILLSIQEESGVSAQPYLQFQQGWLINACGVNLQGLQTAISQFHRAASHAAAFMKDNSGVMGFAKNVARGWMNPVDGIAGLFGESSLDVTARELESNLEAAGHDYDSQVEHLLSRMDTTLVDWWNSNTVHAINQMVTAANSSGESVSLNDYPIVTTQTNGFWSLKNPLFILLLLGGIGFWYFNGSEQMVERIDSTQNLQDQKQKTSLQMIIFKPGPLYQGPGESFEVIVTLEKEVPAQLLDESVPGWIKIKLNDGQEGWAKKQ